MSPELLEPFNCACFNLRRAARQVTRAYDRALRPAGVQATQFTLLSVLAGSEEDDGIAMSDLAGRLGLDRTTLTRNLTFAERAGWVAVAPGADRRERLVSLTAAGREKVEAALPFWQSAQQAVLKQLGSTDLAHLIALSRRLDAN